ncbi:MAG: response regulator [Bacteriovoracaceae bacterium]|nr:response regulator [Bacteriovoracaceae bacterium]
MEEEVLKGKTLLIVDDEVDLRDIVASELEFMGAKVFQAENILKAQQVLKDNPIDLIISDIRMPGGTGIDLLEIVKKKEDAPPMVLITGFADITLEDAFDKGAEALLSKPFKLDDLIKMVMRYTSPFDERFSSEIQTPKILKSLGGEAIEYGRGGAAVEITDLGKRYEVGEVVNFNLHNGNGTLEGQGVCRWIKIREFKGQNHKVYMGLEFVSMKPDSLKHFKEMSSVHHLTPFIPNIGD